MEKEPIIKNKSEKFEITDHAKKVIGLFKAAKMEQNSEKQEELLQQFHEKLLDILIPPSRSKFDRQIFYSDKKLRKIILGENRQYFSDDLISFGTGSHGSRIYFMNNINLTGVEDSNKYAADFTAEELKRGSVKSRDGKPRWMFYKEPSASDGQAARQYWEGYIKNFGDSIVDLEQNIE